MLQPVNLNVYLGDSRELVIPLAWDGQPYAPEETDVLVFTVKRSPGDSDEVAVFQKQTGAGLVASGTSALIDLVRLDSIDLDPCDLYLDIIAVNPVTTRSQPVARGSLHFLRRITREEAAVRPIFTTLPPLFGAIVFNRFTGHYESLFIADTDDDGNPILQSEYYSTQPPASAPLVYNRYTGHQELLFIDETDGDGFPILQTEPV